MDAMAADESTETAAFQALFRAFPGRSRQIKTLAALADPQQAPCGNIIVHGPEATGKSAVTERVLQLISVQTRHAGPMPGGDGSTLNRAPEDAGTADTPGHTSGLPAIGYALVDATKCVTVQHLFERTLTLAARAVGCSATRTKRCDSLAQLAIDLGAILQQATHGGWRFVLVFDAIDRQRDAPFGLLPGLARLAEVIPVLTTVFVVTVPAPSMLLKSGVPHIHFANYSRDEFVDIASRQPPPALANTTAADTADLWRRFVTAVYDTLGWTAGRTLLVFRDACTALWPRFTAPVLAGTYKAREFARLLNAGRLHFHDEALLDPGLVHLQKQLQLQAQAQTPMQTQTGGASAPKPDDPPAARHLASLLPTNARMFLLCAYLASHNAAKHDMTLLSTHHHGRKRRGGGMAGMRGRGGRRAQNRKLSRKLLGAHSFTLERLVAIFLAVRSEWTHAPPVTATGATCAAAVVDADCSTALATLASLRLVVRISGATGDPIDHAGKWRVNVGWEIVKNLGRSMGVDMEDWLIE